MSTGRLPSVDGGIQPTIVDAKGDLIVATAADTVSRLAVGSNDQVLTADSTTATGLKWAAASSGGSNWALLNSGGTALTGATTITVSGISGKDKIMVLISAASAANAVAQFRIRLNTDTASNYYNYGAQLEWSSSTSAADIAKRVQGADTGIFLGQIGAANNALSAYTLLSGCNSSGVKIFNSVGGANWDSGTSLHNYLGGYYDSASTISSVSVVSSSGNFDNGTVYVYTSAS